MHPAACLLPRGVFAFKPFPCSSLERSYTSGNLFLLSLSLAISREKRIGPHSMDGFKSYKPSVPENVPVELSGHFWGHRGVQGRGTGWPSGVFPTFRAGSPLPPSQISYLPSLKMKLRICDFHILQSQDHKQVQVFGSRRESTIQSTACALPQTLDGGEKQKSHGQGEVSERVQLEP